MTNSSTLITLAQWLAGEFENRTQSLDQPVWFVHLHMWYRPLPQRIHGNLGLFAEQAPVVNLDRPYRQRVVVLTETEQNLQAEYMALKQPEKFLGAGANPNLLSNLTVEDLEVLPGCKLTIKQQNQTFIAQPEPDAKCCFHYDGQTRQVVLGFEVSANEFKSYDKGVDPDTGKALWGAIMGPYEYNKCQDFAKELPID